MPTKRHWPGRSLLAILLAAATPTRSWADAGEWTLGGAASYRYAAGHHGAMGLGIAEWGLADCAALRLEGGPVVAFGTPPVRGTLGVGVTLMWDVLRLVPALSVTAGALFTTHLDVQPHVGVDVQLRYHLSESFTLGPSLGARRLSGAWQWTAGAVVLRQL